MADKKFDYKKEYKDLYLPKAKPMLIDVPSIQFFMVDGQGEPGGDAYQKAMKVLYAMTFTIKMSKMGVFQPDGYFDYVLPPLEGLWWSGDKALDWKASKSSWQWTSMIRQPEFVTLDVFEWAKEECIRKKPNVDISGIRLEQFSEGLCVQMMHIGPYDDEQRTMEQMRMFIGENGYEDMTGNVRKHHEIYLSDPRKTQPERLKTVLRIPVAAVK